jgi:trehalose 6-phosphate phosphatase
MSALETALLPPPAPDWALYLDVDGTLIELGERPDAVRADRELRELLQKASGTGQGALALISGRSLADLDALFSPLRFPAAGQHGVERRDATGGLHGAAVGSAMLREAASRLEAFARQRQGLLLEDKGSSLALHYRRAPEREGEVRAAMAAVAMGLGGGFELQNGKMVLEIKCCGRDKGTAIEQFNREAPFAGRRPVFVGDDQTDEYGFAVVNRLGGESIKVGDGPSSARWRLPDVGAVRKWLGGWVSRFGEEAEPWLATWTWH